MRPVIQVSAIRKTYGSTVAVDDVSFEVSDGEIFGLIGPNGAGKTTTMECIEGLRTLDRGAISVLGLDPFNDVYKLQVRIGVQLAQDQQKETEAKNVEESVDAYRLDFSFNELEEGKKLNTRRYTIELTGGRTNEIKIGTRIPVVTANCNSSSSSSSESASEQYQCIDLGTHIWAHLISHGSELHVTGDISSLDTSAGSGASSRLGPVIRQIKIEGSTALVLGKPIIIGSADDPNSKRQFQLEVVVAKLK